jgi:hypothetical protein
MRRTTAPSRAASASQNFWKSGASRYPRTAWTLSSCEQAKHPDLLFAGRQAGRDNALPGTLPEAAYWERGGMDETPPYVEDTGEVNWLVADAIRMEVPVPVIAQSVMQLFSSRDDRKAWARAIALIRHGFGGHPFGASEAIRRERHEGRVDESEVVQE